MDDVTLPLVFEVVEPAPASGPAAAAAQARAQPSRLADVIQPGPTPQQLGVGTFPQDGDPLPVVVVGPGAPG